MSVRDNFTLDNAKEIIEYALEQLYKNDSALVQYPSIKEAVSENCLLFRIGLYMHDFIRQNSLFSNISVDCQYNRNFQHPKSMFKPTLEGIEKAVKNPIPDLLLHQRGSNENNLFLIELKKGNPCRKKLKMTQKSCVILPMKLMNINMHMDFPFGCIRDLGLGLKYIKMGKKEAI